MRYKVALISFLWFSFSQSQAQLLIGNNAQLITGNTSVTTNGSLINNGSLSFDSGANLFLTGQGILSSNILLDIPNLYMSGSAYTIDGTIYCQESMQLKNGVLTPNASARLVVDRSAVVISENEGQVNGRLYHAGENNRFYPVGKNGVYAPVTLLGVTDEREIGLEAFNQDLGVTQFPADVVSASPNWYWEISAESNFEGAVIQLPVTSDDAGIIGADGIATVLQSDSNGSSAIDLGRESNSDFLSITSELPAVGPYLLLGFETGVKPVIHNIITPRNDDRNPFLIIDHVDAITENEVILLDRWGNEVFKEKNFTNYAKNGSTGRPYDGAFDGLPSGNYICLLKYQGVVKKQMITVLEE